MDSIGKAAYNAYCASRGWKSFDGRDLPPFEGQSLELQEAWGRAGQAAVREFVTEIALAFGLSCSPMSK